MEDKRIRIILDTILKNNKNVDILRNELVGLGSQYSKLAPQIIGMSNKMDLLGKKNKFISEWSNKLGVNTARVKQIMGNQGIAFNEFGNIVDMAGRKVTNLGNIMQTGKIKTRPFEMQWLSVLFLSMQLNRTMNSLVKTSLEWVGVTELWNTTLGVVFLPIAEAVLETLLPIMLWFMELPEGVQKSIGAIVLITTALTGLLTILSQFALLDFAFVISKLSGIGVAAQGAANGGATMLLSKLGKIAKYIGATILFGMAFKDGSEGELTAALGDILMGIGFLKIGTKAAPWLMGIGLVLKLVGDADFLTSLLKTLLKALDAVAKFGEDVGKIIVDSLKGKKIDWGSLRFVKSFGSAIDEINAEGGFQSGLLSGAAYSNYNALGNPILPSGLGSPIFKESEMASQGNLNVSPVYYVNVSDKKEFELMLERNNRNLTESIRRSVKS